jgi:hypothetical protein
MHSAISIVHDSQRGCGFRHKTGALYFMSDNAGVPCGVLPLELKPCPTCAAMGLKCRVSPTRGYTWIDPSRTFDWKSVSCPQSFDGGLCRDCSMSMISRLERCGLLWIGEKFYPTPDDFDKEARKLGISRRLPHDHLPVGFKIGEDFIMLAHKKSVLRLGVEGETLVDYFPGVFRIFKPQRVEVLCDGTETDEVIEGYLKRGLTPVKVERNG